MWPGLGHGLHGGTSRHIATIRRIQVAALPGKGVESTKGLSQLMVVAARRRGREREIGGLRALESGAVSRSNRRIGWGADSGEERQTDTEGRELGGG